MLCVLLLRRVLDPHRSVELGHEHGTPGPAGDQVIVLGTGEPEPSLQVPHQHCGDVQVKPSPAGAHTEERIDNVRRTFFGHAGAAVSDKDLALVRVQDYLDPAWLTFRQGAPPLPKPPNLKIIF